MANAVILILVIGYCLFLISNRFRIEKPENISAVQAVAVTCGGLQRLQRVQDRRKQEKTLTGVKQQ